MKKKLLILSLLLLVTLALFTVCAYAAKTESETTYEMGDANLDGDINT